MPELSSTLSTPSNPFTFRTAQETVVLESTPSIKVDPGSAVLPHPVDVTPTYLEYKEMNDTPFVAMALGLDKFYGELNYVDRHHINVIEQYVDTKMRSGEFSDTQEVAKSILKKLEDSIGIQDEHSPYYKLEKLSELLKVLPDPVATAKQEVKPPTPDIRQIAEKHTQELKSIKRETKEAQVQATRIQKMLLERDRATRALADERKKTIARLMQII